MKFILYVFSTDSDLEFWFSSLNEALAYEKLFRAKYKLSNYDSLIERRPNVLSLYDCFND